MARDLEIDAEVTIVRRVDALARSCKRLLSAPSQCDIDMFLNVAARWVPGA